MNISPLAIELQLSCCGIGNEATHWSLADRAYAMPSHQWLLGPFAASLGTLQFEFRVKQWSAEDNDCDDFARLAASFAQVLHVNTPDHPPATALAVGELWYVLDDGGAHAINIAICGPNISDVVFFDPQTRDVKTLSSKELTSATMIRF